MRRDKKLGEDIIHTLCNHNRACLTVSEVCDELKLVDLNDEERVAYHVEMLEDIGLVSTEIDGNIRLTSTGQDRAENRDSRNPMDSWLSLNT